MSGAQWSAERLLDLALLVSPPSRKRLKHDGLEEAAAALRAFASVLEEGVTCPECHSVVLLNEEPKP